MAPPMAETQEYWITVQFREVLINYVILTMSEKTSVQIPNFNMKN